MLALNRMRRPAICAAALAVLVGCNKAADSPPKPAGKPAALAIVVSDPQVAKQISRLRGEWKAQSGIELNVRQSTADQVSAEELKGADALIFPTSQLGVLAEAKLIRPLPAAWLNRDDFHKSELFDPGGFAECRWGEQTYAVPFGSPVFVLMYRRDIFERCKLSPPRTWAEYQQAISVLKSHQGDEKLKSLAAEPLAPGWAGKILLARAAAYAKHPDYYATLFDKDTMAPQIAGPPFVRALEELLAAQKTNVDADWRAATPETARASLLAGDCAMAITWPTGASKRDAATKSTGESSKPANNERTPHGSTAVISFAELPGANEVFNPRSKSWSPDGTDDNSPRAAEVANVPLAGVAGLLGGVTSESKSGEAALQLLSWLSGDEWGSQILSSTSQTTIFRRSQLKQAGRWVEPELLPAAKQYADVVAASLTRQQWLGCLQIPGDASYMTALDEAVRTAVRREKTPEESLANAAKRWQEITAKAGIESQRAAYIRSLGLEP